MTDFVLHYGRYRLFYFMNPGIAKLINPAASSADDMVMLFARKGFLKLGDILSKLMLDNQSAIQQKFHGVVQRSPAYPVAVVFHVDIQRFDIEMSVPCINLIQNCESFGRFPVALLFNVF